MGTGLIKIKDKYFEWSSCSDAPTTYGMSKKELRRYIKEEYGNKGVSELDGRIKRCEEFGTSFHGETLEDVLLTNRAGKNEEHLSADEIYKSYGGTE